MYVPPLPLRRSGSNHTHTHTHYTRLAATQKQVGHIEVFAGGAGRANRATRAGFWRVGTCQRSIRTAIRRNRPPTGPRSACARRKTSNSPIASVVRRECYTECSARDYIHTSSCCAAHGRIHPRAESARIRRRHAFVTPPVASALCLIHRRQVREYWRVVVDDDVDLPPFPPLSPVSALFSRRPPPRCCTSATNAICASFFASGRAALLEIGMYEGILLHFGAD